MVYVTRKSSGGGRYYEGEKMHTNSPVGKVAYSDLSVDESDCSAERFAELEIVYLTAQKVETYCNLGLLVAAAVVNIEVLRITTRGHHNCLRRKTVYPKIALLAIFDLLTVGVRTLSNLDQLFSITYGVQLAPYWYSALFCKVPYYLYHVADGISMWLVVILAFERYVAIRHPFLVVRYQSRRLLHLSMFTLLVVSCLICAPKLVTLDSEMLSEAAVLCDSRKDDPAVYYLDRVHTVLLATLFTILPASLLVLFSALLVAQVRKATERSIELQRRSLTEPSTLIVQVQQAARSRYLRLTIMVLTIAVVYTVLQIPDLVAWTLGHFTDQQSVCRRIHVASVFAYASTTSDLATITNAAIFLCCRRKDDSTGAARGSNYHILPKRTSVAVVADNNLIAAQPPITALPE